MNLAKMRHQRDRRCWESATRAIVTVPYRLSAAAAEALKERFRRAHPSQNIIVLP